MGTPKPALPSHVPAFDTGALGARSDLAISKLSPLCLEGEGKAFTAAVGAAESAGNLGSSDPKPEGHMWPLARFCVPLPSEGLFVRMLGQSYFSQNTNESWPALLCPSNGGGRGPRPPQHMGWPAWIHGSAPKGLQPGSKGRPNQGAGRRP